MATKNYTLYLASADKVSGTNNNAVFNVNWESFLPRDFDTYQITFNFSATAGFYRDTADSTRMYSHCKIVLDTQGRSFSYDTSNSGNSLTLGYANREPSNSHTQTNGYNSFFGDNAPKTINRPTQNQINVKIYNVQLASLLTNTDNAGASAPTADMTPWVMTLSFTPVGAKPDNFPYVVNQ